MDIPINETASSVDNTLDLNTKTATVASNAPESGDGDGGGGRSLRKRSNRSNTTAPPLKKTKSSSSVVPNGEDHTPSSSSSSLDIPMEKARHLITSWICAECKEAECITDPESPLLVCEGPCLRLFHFPCAQLSTLPPKDEPWICHDCTQQRHKCCACQEYGIDHVQVYKCEKKTCGLFYHEQCLAMYDLVTMHRTPSVSTSSSSSSSASGNGEARGEEIQEGGTLNHNTSMSMKFKCPAHHCWTCSGGIPEDEEEGEETGNGTQKRKETGETARVEKTTKSDPPVSLSKKKTTKNKWTPCFHEKSGDLIRCMECPNSFHITCISPKCQFHELALLCHEHAHTNKLPYLDYSSSIQGRVEAKVDEMFTSHGRKKNLVHSYSSSTAMMRRENKFLPGLKGDIFTQEQMDVSKLLNGTEMVVTSGFFPTFYFPVDIKNEVHAKLPSFTQIQSSRIDPSNRPKRHPPSMECCQCKVSCDAHCLNRIAGMECVGNSNNKSDHTNPYRNCNLGQSCGNRQLTSREVAKCKPVRETGKGWGLVSVHGVQSGNLVLEYVGEVIDEKKKQSRLEAWSIEHPNDPNFYIMSLESGWYIDAREMGNLSRFINHSCDPNCQLSRIIVAGHLRIAIVAIRDVAPGEFLSYDYHFDTKDGDKFICRCGADKCRGTMKGGVNNSNGAEVKKKTKRELWLQAKARLDKDKKFLDEIAQSEKSRLHLGKVYQPGEENNESATLISSGPQARTKHLIPGGTKVFLWRNAIKGSNFYSRYQKWIKKNSE